MSHESFQSALQRLVEDKAYRKAVSVDGKKLRSDFNLNDQDMAVMKQVGVLSGWVDAGKISTKDVNCCCCCCPA